MYRHMEVWMQEKAMLICPPQGYETTENVLKG
jgi:hypothetical protein